ncbi:MAG: hypothetical protein ACLQBJ_16055 [Bryobacteraceae bacterium]
MLIRPRHAVYNRYVRFASLVLAGAAVCAAFSPVRAAAPAPAEDPAAKGREVVMQSLAALGGDLFLAMRDRIEDGRAYSFFNEKLSGLSLARIYTRYLTPPDPPAVAFIGQRERQVFGKDETAYVLLDENRGFNVTYRGAKPIQDPDYARYRESLLHNIFYILRMRLKEPGMGFESRGLDLYNNVPVDVVDIYDNDNRTVTVYFDEMTHYPVRQLWYQRNQITHDRDEEVTVFSKFRDTQGVKWPWVTLRERNGERIYEIFCESVKIDTGVTDEKFTLPANMKIIQGPEATPGAKATPGRKK